MKKPQVNEAMKSSFSVKRMIMVRNTVYAGNQKKSILDTLFTIMRGFTLRGNYFSLVICSLLAFSFSFKGHSQTYYGVSQNSQYYADCEQIKAPQRIPPMNYYKIRMFHLPSQNPLLTFTTSASNELFSVQISYSGQLMALRFAFETRIYDVTTRSEIKVLHGNNEVFFPNYDHTFLIDGAELKSFESFTGKELITYKGAGVRTPGRDVIFDPQDRYIIMKSSPHLFLLWKVGEPRRYKKFRGNTLRIDPVDNKITVFNNAKFSTFSGNDLRTEYEGDLARIGREFEKEQKGKGQSVSVKTHSFVPSPAGNFVLIPFTNTEKKYQLLLVSTRHLEYRPLKYEFLNVDSCRWANDSALVLFQRELAPQIMTLGNETEILSPVEPVLLKELSPDYSYIVKQKSSFLKKKLQVKNTLTQQIDKIDASKLIMFTPNSRMIITQKGKRAGVVFLDSPDKSFHPFKDSVIPVKEMELDDAEYPKNYKSDQILSFVPINQKKDSAGLKLLLRNVEQNDSIVSVNVHLMNDNGTYYTGAATEEWKTVWCNFILRDQSKNLRQITNFTVTEHQQRDSVPSALILVLDHSGSMGEKRALTLEEGAELFIQRKARKDMFGIIKYDDKTKIECKLTDDKSKLLHDFKKEGLKNYGGGTALLDATGVAVSNLKNLNSFKRKEVILLTDGNENSSRTNRTDIIRRAAANDIKIHTVAFGDNVSEMYLKGISKGTSGSFYHIYKKQDLTWIFNDIYNKVNNYYEVKFKLQDYGKFVAILKACLGEKSDAVKADIVRKRSTEKWTEEDEDDAPASTREEKQLLTQNISDFSGMKTDNPVTEKAELPSDTVDLVTVEEEFEKIVFPDIKFKFDLAEVIPGTDKGIENVAVFMKRYPFVRIEIGGHTDDAGNHDHNIALSMQRADAVKNILVGLGADASRLSTKGYGETKALVPNTSEENRQKNRRVEFVIISHH